MHAGACSTNLLDDKVCFRLGTVWCNGFGARNHAPRTECRRDISHLAAWRIIEQSIGPFLNSDAYLLADGHRVSTLHRRAAHETEALCVFLEGT